MTTPQDSMPFTIVENTRGFSLRVRISLKDGLHTRPAARIAQAAQQFRADILIIGDTGEVDAKSLLDVLSLSPPPNAALTLLAHGPDAREALVTLATLLEHLED